MITASSAHHPTPARRQRRVGYRFMRYATCFVGSARRRMRGMRGGSVEGHVLDRHPREMRYDRPAHARTEPRQAGTALGTPDADAEVTCCCRRRRRLLLLSHYPAQRVRV